MTSRSSRTPQSAQASLPFDEGDLPRERRGGTLRSSGAPFIAQLAGLCREQPARAKWVFVPTHAVGYALGDRLAREGTDWVNLRFVTPLEVAIRMAGPFLVERGIDPSEETLGPALVMRLLLDLTGGARGPDQATSTLPGGAPDAGGAGYFRPMAEHTPLAAALWSTLRELRLAGLRAIDVPREAFVSAEKHAELVALVLAYERFLERHRIADMAAVFAEAPNHIDFCPILAADLVLDVPDVVWPALTRRFLDALPGDRLTPHTLLLPGAVLPRRLARRAPGAIWTASPPGSGVDAARLVYLRAPAQAGPARADGTIDVFHAGGREAEVDEVLRRVFASGRRLDEVEVACASDTQALLVWEAACRLDWPVTLSCGVPASFTRPGRALLGWCAWVEADFDASVLRRLMQSGDVALARGRRPVAGAGSGPDHDAGVEDLSPGQAARLLQRAEAAWGRYTYSGALTRLADRYGRRAADPELGDDERQWAARRATQTRRLLTWVTRLLDAVPVIDGSNLAALETIAGAAARFLEENASRASALDAAAQVALGEAIAELRPLGDYRCSLATALRFVRERADALRVGRDRARPGHLHVSRLGEAGLDARPLTFLVGLEEGHVFPPAVEDPVLLDVEREGIMTALAARLGTDQSRVLRTSRDRQDEAVFGVVARLASLGIEISRWHAPASPDQLLRAGSQPASVTFSFSCRDTREFRDAIPSWLVLQAWRLLRGDATLTYADLHEGLGEPASAVPSSPRAAPTTAGWWLAHTRGGAAAQRAVLDAYPPLSCGAQAEACRRATAFGIFDGLVPAAGAALDLTGGQRAISATTLEQAAACPFSFFLRHALEVEPLDDVERELDAWLDPRTRGSELHSLYAALMRRARGRNRRVLRAHDLAWLIERGRERLDALRREMPPPSEAVFDNESREFLDDLEAFVDAEAKATNAEPVAFEVSFGLPRQDDTPRTDAAEGGAEPLASEEPVEIPLGRGRWLLLHGRIDRIDRVGPGEYEIIDYKTGRFWRDDWQGTFAGGVRLQHAVYGVAAEALLNRARAGGRSGDLERGAHVVRAVYRFPTGRGYGREVKIDAPSRAALARVLGDLAAVIAGGTFAHAVDEGSCRWCEFAAACGSDPVARAKAKLEAEAGGRLAAFARLKGHE